MKNRKSIFAFFAISAAMIFASCSNLTDANVTSSSEDKNTLNIEVTNYDEVVTQASKSANHASRTIIPDSFDSTGVVFYLYGTNTSGGTFGPEKVDFTPKTGSNTIGTISIPANSAVWEFTLVALATGATAPTDEATLKDNAVLIGYSSMDMLNGDTAKFTLSPDGLTKEAEIAMKLYTEGWALPTGFTAKAGIYLLTTGADAGTDAAPTEKEVAFTDATINETNTVDYAIASFAPGTYLFKVTFEKTGSNKKFYWSDVLVVLPGKTINNAVGIPNIIGTAPTAPTAFKAGYVENSEDKFSGWYTTAFEWERGSKNENNFEIEVLEFKDADTAVTLPTSDDEWTAASTAGSHETYDSKFSSEANYESGSLLSGNTKAQLRLELGKRYFARIRAVNDAGESAWTLVALADAPAEPTGTQKFTGTTINRYRLKYFMNGGTYYADKTAADADTGGSTADKVSYHCEDSAAGTEIIKADGTPIIKKNTYTWSYWSKDGKSETASRYNEPGAAPEAYTDYKNLDLYAMFTTDASVAIFDKKSLEIQDGWITVDTGTLTGKTATIEVATETEVKWTFTPGEVKDAEGKKIENFAYDKVNFTVTKGGTTFEAKSADNVGAATEFAMSLSNLPAGIYQVMFTAHYGTTTVSYPITTTITR
ncbi:MAG: hypothetical protein PUD00_09385 [Treponema berlinense]|uniref:hypothetical protein n=1 Tax=Treponema berlinense TaxID=225004 RepID=UPI0023F24806|nr:hypothetical protein [Treponema berlinense]MDD5835429.1 hypothetical protein [Treponema berlinense]